MQQVMVAVRVIVFLGLLAVAGYLGLMLRDKWAREAEQQRQPPVVEPAAAEPAG